MATEAVETARRILAMHQHHQEIASAMRSRSGLQLLELLYERPVISTPQVAERLDVTYPTAKSVLQEFQDHGLLGQSSKEEHPRLFVYTPYLDLLAEGTTP